MYHPEGNSEVECLNRILGETVQTVHIETSCQNCCDRVSRYIPREATTGETPSVILYGRHMRTLLDIVELIATPNPLTAVEVEDRVNTRQAKAKESVKKGDVSKPYILRRAILFELRNLGMYVKVRVNSQGLLKSSRNVVRILTSWPTEKME